MAARKICATACSVAHDAGPTCQLGALGALAEALSTVTYACRHFMSLIKVLARPRIEAPAGLSLHTPRVLLKAKKHKGTSGGGQETAPLFLGLSLAGALVLNL